MLFRMQEQVPQVYVTESRDFQLLCRLFDAWVNGAKLDADLMQYTIDTHYAKNNTLNLLQTKLGFFTQRQLTDVMMRFFLCVFPDSIKWKGSFNGITYAVNAFIKSLNINDKVYIGLDTKNEFNIVIKTTVRIDNIDKLEEFLSYIIPVGFTYEFQFYTALPEMETIVEYSTNGAFIVADNKTNASIRYSVNDFDKGDKDIPVFTKDDYLIVSKEPKTWYTEWFEYYYYDVAAGEYKPIEKGQPPTFTTNTYYSYNDSTRKYNLLKLKPSDWDNFWFNYYYSDGGTYRHVGYNDHKFEENKYYKNEKQLWDMTVTNVGLAGLSGTHDIEGQRILEGVVLGDTI